MWINIYTCVICWFFILLHKLRVFENRPLRKIFGPMRGEVTGVWRRLHSEELHGLYFSPNIFRIIKARRMGWAGYVARMGRGEVYSRYWWGDLRERDEFEDLGLYMRIILKWIFMN